MRGFILGIVVAITMCGCAAKTPQLDSSSVQKLTTILIGLSPKVEEREAQLLAYEAILYPRELALQYKLVSPPLLHNSLINIGLKERGLCYEWSEDMMAHLKARGYQSFDLRWGVANKGLMDEHNSVVVVAKGEPFESGVLLDPWRNSGELYFAKLHEDSEYKWVENKERSHYFGTITQ